MSEEMMPEKELQDALETIIDMTSIDVTDLGSAFEEETDTAQFALVW